MLRPRCTKIALNRAASDAITRSHPSARLSPAPAATPFTLATVGFATLAQRGRAPPDAAHVLEPLARGARHPRVDQVGARAEAVAGTGDHEDSVVAVAGDLVEHVLEAAPHLAGDRVHLVGPIERERHHAVATVDEEIRHGPLP